MTKRVLQAEHGALTEPLWDVTTVSYPHPNNAMFVREYTIKLLSTSFPNMTSAEVQISCVFSLEKYNSKLVFNMATSGHSICEWDV